MGAGAGAGGDGIGGGAGAGPGRFEEWGGIDPSVDPDMAMVLK